MTSNLLKLTAAGALLIGAQAAQAVVISGDFSVVIDSSYKQGIGYNYANGETLTGTFSYDTDAAQLVDECTTHSNASCWRDQGRNDSWVDINYSFMGNSYHVDLSQTTAVYDMVYVENDRAHGGTRDFFQVLDQDYLNNNGYYANDYAYFYVQDWLNEIVSDTNVEQSFSWSDTDASCGNYLGYNQGYDGTCGRFYAQDYDSNGANMWTHGYMTSLNVNVANVAKVAEPGTLTLFGLGLIGLGLSRRRSGK